MSSPRTDTAPVAAALVAHGLALRPATPHDRAFLYRVYAATRAEELAPLGWSDAQRQAFLTMQFEAQHSHYHTHYQGAAFEVILRDGEPLGRLYLDRWPRELRIVDIALLPEHRGQGIGSSVLGAVLRYGRRLGLPVSIHVERTNPALRLYRRLGFRQAADNGVYLLLERMPDA